MRPAIKKKESAWVGQVYMRFAESYFVLRCLVHQGMVPFGT